MYPVAGFVKKVDREEGEIATELVGMGDSLELVALDATHVGDAGIGRGRRRLVDVARDGERIIRKREENSAHHEALGIVMAVVDFHAHGRDAGLEVVVVDGRSQALACELVVGEVRTNALDAVEIHGRSSFLADSTTSVDQQITTWYMCSGLTRPRCPKTHYSLE